MVEKNRFVDNNGCCLKYLFESIACDVSRGTILNDQKVCSLTADSRKVESGCVFVAIRGITTDGHRFVTDAVDAGAAAIVIENSYADLFENVGNCVVISVENTTDVLGLLAARFYGSPADQLIMTGVTGTNGKTTVAHLIEHVLCEAGFQTGMIGTVTYRWIDENGNKICLPAKHTTPDPITLHRCLRRMVDDGVTHVVMEVSSHALAQKRLGPIRFTTAAFTNISQDHLDYHRDMEDYFSAKCRLFTDYMSPAGVIVIYDPALKNSVKSGWARRVVTCAADSGIKIIVCGKADDARFRYLRSCFEKSGMSLVFRDINGDERVIGSPLTGDFNAENLLLTIAVLYCHGLETDKICESLSHADGAPGRFEQVMMDDEQPLVFVDYAHTPDALKNVLDAAAKLPHRALFCVFGCGGDRDHSKRAEMGAIAAACSTVAIITDDNPRSENPAAIREMVVAGVHVSGKDLFDSSWLCDRGDDEHGCVEIGDRKEAIEAAVCCASAEDIVVIAGKGHEQYQILNDKIIFFDDRLAAIEAGISWNSRLIAKACSGRLVRAGYGACCRAISTDTRSIHDGDVFVALTGNYFDGHAFIDKAVEKGASCLVVSKDITCGDPTVGVVMVEDTLQALGDLAHTRRKLLQKIAAPVVVCITGSSGKTTVKEMVAAVFRKNWPVQDNRLVDIVLNSEGNFNNLVGLPLSLLPASVHHRALVLEMGMNRPGEIRRLTEIADPTIGCITNVSHAHLEGLGSIEGVAAAKDELFAAMLDDSVMIVNLDDDLIVRNSQNHRHPSVTFAVTARGIAAGPDVWGTDVSTDLKGHLSFTLHIREKSVAVSISSPGLHNCANACCAAAIAHAAGVGIDTIAAGLADFRSPVRRMEHLKTAAGLNLLNDCYNANPASMASALETLAGLPAQRRVAVLGDMLELGDESSRLHEELGKQVAAAGVSYLCVLGEFKEMVARGAVSNGFDQNRLYLCPDHQHCVEWLNELVHSGTLDREDWLLIKASRGAALDQIVDRLMEENMVLERNGK